jgi:cystathionine gamma-lyase
VANNLCQTHFTLGCAFSSGSATTAALTSLFGQKSHILSINDVYGGTNCYLKDIAASFGIETTFVDMADVENIKRHIRTNTKVICCSTLC